LVWGFENTRGGVGTDRVEKVSSIPYHYLFCLCCLYVLWLGVNLM
jgi:hypothetical protein